MIADKLFVRSDAGWYPHPDAPVTQVARRLLGSTISHAGVSVRITETEAYRGSDDPGAHSYRGMTARTEAMFDASGGVYVYFTYGMHHALNIVCGPQGVGHAVLVRAGQVVGGIELARSRRKGSDRDLARGPGRLAQALDLNLSHNRTRLDGPQPQLLLSLGEPVADVCVGPRVGVSGAGGDGTAFPWRFWISDDPFVSAYRAAKPRRSPADA